MNRIFAKESISPIRSQTRTKLQHQSKGILYRLLPKLNRGIASLRGMIYVYSSVMFSNDYSVEILEKLPEALAPGESKELLKLAQLSTDTERHQVTNAHASNEIVHNIKLFDMWKIIFHL